MGLAAACVAAVACLMSAARAEHPKVSFKKVRVDSTFRSEGTAVGDFNHDGKLDISAGSVYYAGPDWKMVRVREKPDAFDPHNYSDSFANFAEDINGDGRTDLVVVDFPGKQTWWFEQPDRAGAAWQRHEATPITNNESPALVDLNGDGRRELILAFDPGKHIGYASPSSTGLWTLHPVSYANAPGTDQYSHGLGAGDLSGDGKPDLLVTGGWWEAPGKGKTAEWFFHAANFGDPCAQMHVYDFDGDGDADILTSSAHNYGIWWHEHVADGWRTHEIDRSFSQSHSLCMADINGDGLPDFVTGKRWLAHGPKGDPGSGEPAVMFWFELARRDGKPVWTPHRFDDDSGIGTQFEVADVNGDGLLDVVTSNKKGTHYFQQVREP